MKIPIPPDLQRILAETPALARAYLAGGSVRDGLLRMPQHDFDVEVYETNYDALVRALGRWGKTDLVGRSFGVVKLALPGMVVDFSLPRRDSKTGPGHHGFSVTPDPLISPREAAARRDFTINAMMYDPREDQLLDFFGGLSDLENRILRHTSVAFPEDPLRVLRGMQLVARFGLKPAPETVALCKRIRDTYSELAAERVREEWFKWAAKSSQPSAGVRFLFATDWIKHYPEIRDLDGTVQDPEWHPEGDALQHTLHCCDALVKLEEWGAADAESRVVYQLAVLAHDFGKAGTTRRELRKGRMRIVSPGHEKLSRELAEKFLERINAPESVRRRVLPLVANHMAYLESVGDRAIRRLSKRLEPETIQSLALLMRADQLGRPPQLPARSDRVDALLQKAAALKVASGAPRPILQGRHLIELGWTPGKNFKPMLDRAYDAQLTGVFADKRGALRWLKRATTSAKAGGGKQIRSGKGKGRK